MATTPPREAARAAFDQLDTHEKTGFVLEATFNTIGQALEETGRRVADVVESFNLDDLFTADPVEPEAPKAKAKPRKKPATRKKATPRAKTTPPPSKTAGKTKPTDDDDA